MSPATKKEIAGAVLNYLAAHPAATDTVEGIMHWWLAEPQGAVSCKLVLEALCQLVAEGTVTARLGPDGRLLYKLNQEDHGPVS